MVGQAVYKLLKEKNYKIISCKRNDLDLTNQQDVNLWFKKKRPQVVINAAGRVGGILDNSKFQTDYIYINTICLLYTSPSPRDRTRSRMPSSA